MGRPVIINDERLLDAAREVFLELGVTATTAEVARRAGISQASIFKRFKTKQDLFLAAMREERDRRDWPGLLRLRAEEVGLRRALVDVGVQLVEFARRVFPLIMMSWSNRGEFGFAVGTSNGRAGPYGRFRELVASFEAEMQAGRLRRQDAWSVVHIYLGALHSFVLIEMVDPSTRRGVGPREQPEAYVESVVEVLWAGLAPVSHEGPPAMTLLATTAGDTK
jgi:AcrR family transcriptional regulator